MPDELKNLLLAYSLRGMREWIDATTELKDAASRCLVHAIAESEQQARWFIGCRRTTQTIFIPMPRHGCKGFEWCFFLPTKVDSELVAVTLFILVNLAGNCIAFRFECSTEGRHAYSHAQLTRRLRDGCPWPGVPEWLPDSYPALPLPAPGLDRDVPCGYDGCTRISGWCGRRA